MCDQRGVLLHFGSAGADQVVLATQRVAYSERIAKGIGRGWRISAGDQRGLRGDNPGRRAGGLDTPPLGVSSDPRSAPNLLHALDSEQSGRRPWGGTGRGARKGVVR